jgi:hypothetical protein
VLTLFAPIDSTAGDARHGSLGMSADQLPMGVMGVNANAAPAPLQRRPLKPHPMPFASLPSPTSVTVAPEALMAQITAAAPHEHEQYPSERSSAATFADPHRAMQGTMTAAGMMDFDLSLNEQVRPKNMNTKSSLLYG